MSHNRSAAINLHSSPLLSSLVQSVEAEERVIEAIISCVETNDSDGVLRAASELMVLRRSSTDENCAV